MHYIFNENNIKNYKVPLCADIIYTPTRNERNLLFLANLLSLKSKVKSGKHASFIVDPKDNILSIFVNSFAYDVEPHIKEKLKLNQTTVHAEIGAMHIFKTKQLNIDPSQCRLIVVRGGFSGRQKYSRPCLNCYKSILELGIKEIIYSGSENTYRKMYINNNFEYSAIASHSRLNI